MHRKKMSNSIHHTMAGHYAVNKGLHWSTQPQSVHAPHKDELDLCPGHGHVDPADVLEKLTLVALADKGHNDDLFVTTLVLVYCVDLYTADVNLGGR